MGIIDDIRALLTGDDDDPTFVCLNCGSGYEREVAECTECGNPHVAPTAEETGE